MQTEKTTWVIGSTGSNNYNTTISDDIKKYLREKKFTKVFKGNPTFSTNYPYSEQEMEEIAHKIKEIRLTGKNETQIKVVYWQAGTQITL